MAPYNEPSFDKQAALATDYADDKHISNRWKRRLEGIAEAISDTTAAVAASNTVNLTESTITSLVNGIVIGIRDTFINVGTVSVPGVTAEPAVHKAVCQGSSSVPGILLFNIIDSDNVTIATNVYVWANLDELTGVPQYGNNILITGNSSYVVGDEFAVIQVNFPFGVTSDYKRDLSITIYPTAAVSAVAEVYGSPASFKIVPDVNVLTIPKVNVKTDTNDTVAISGSVTASGTVAVSTDSNGNAVGVDSSGNTTTPSVPVSHSGLPSVTVNTTGVAVPVSSTATGLGKNSSGTVVSVPVINSSNVTVDLSTGQTCTLAANQQCTLAPNSVVTATGTVQLASNQQCTLAPGQVCGVDPNATVDVAATSITIPVAPTSITVPVENTNNVTIPVTASGSVLDVKIVEISSTAPSGGVAPTEAFEAAMEDALNDAVDIDVKFYSNKLSGHITAYNSSGSTVKDMNGDTGTFNVLRTKGGTTWDGTNPTFNSSTVYTVVRDKLPHSGSGLSSAWYFADHSVDVNVINPSFDGRLYGFIQDHSGGNVGSSGGLWDVYDAQGTKYTAVEIRNGDDIIVATSTTVPQYRGFSVQRNTSTSTTWFIVETL